jgi:hypothetical protein
MAKVRYVMCHLKLAFAGIEGKPSPADGISLLVDFKGGERLEAKKLCCCPEAGNACTDDDYWAMRDGAHDDESTFQLRVSGGWWR